MSGLGAFCFRHRVAVCLVWLVVLVAGFGLGSQVFGRLSDTGGAADSESVRGFELLQESAETGPRVVAVIDGRPTEDPAVRSAVSAASASLRATPGIQAVLDVYSTPAPQLRATDGRASSVVVDLAKDLPAERQDELVALARDTLHDVERVGGIDVSVGGERLLFQEINQTVERDLARGELLSLPVAMVAMVFVFGGVVAAGLPLTAAIVSVAGTLLLLLGLSTFSDVSSNALSVVTVLGLGIAIDYSLLMVMRFREECAAGGTPEQAVRRMAATAGRTVAFSGLTIAASLAGLLVFEDPTFRSIGAAGVGVVVLALAASLTLIPALLGLLHRRVALPAGHPGRFGALSRLSRRLQRPTPDEGFFSRLTRRVQRHRLVVVLLTAVLLMLGLVPFLGARFENAGPRLIPASFETRKAYDAIQTRFTGSEVDPITVVGRLSIAEMTSYAAAVRSLPGVRSVGEPTQRQAGVTAMEILPAGSSQGPQARELVKQLRAGQPAVLVTGAAAFLVDFRSEIVSRGPYALALIMVATLILLFLLTGSVLVPVKALVMNVLSLGASFGALVWIFQDGNLSGVLGFESTGAIETFVPVIVFVFAFGLSMDYEVFLLARIKELYDAGYSNDEAVALGLQRSGRIITSAALLITIVFTGFATGQMIGIKQIGVALALAVVIDATIVRCLLVPATMSLLGDRNWWAPGPLRRLHDRIGLAEAGPSTKA